MVFCFIHNYSTYPVENFFANFLSFESLNGRAGPSDPNKIVDFRFPSIVVVKPSERNLERLTLGGRAFTMPLALG